MELDKIEIEIDASEILDMSDEEFFAEKMANRATHYGISAEIVEKIRVRQTSISTNEDLSGYGYIKQGIVNVQLWRTKDNMKIYNDKWAPINGPKRQSVGNKWVYMDEDYRADWESQISGVSSAAEKGATGQRLAGHHHMHDPNDDLAYIIPLTASEHKRYHVGTLTYYEMDMYDAAVEKVMANPRLFTGGENK
jgi:hypothetical protein